MLESLKKLFSDTLGLDADLWAVILIAVVAIAFIATLATGLLCGRFKQIKSNMKSAIANPASAVVAMKRMPASIKTQYKNARVGNLKPSMLVTENMCVGEPYRHSLISKVWLVTFVTTVICAGIGFCVSVIAVPSKNNPMLGTVGMYATPTTVLIAGGLFTLIGAIVGKCAYNGAVKTYEKFMPVMDGDQSHAAVSEPMAQTVEPQQMYAEPQQSYAEPQQAYAEPQQAYAEPQQAYAEPQQQPYVEPQAAYAEPQQAYAEPQQVYAEQPPVVNVTPQESDEEIRRKAREEALAQARAQQAQAQAAAQAQAQAQKPAQSAPSGGSSVDSVIAQIEKIDRDGAPRETMREVATLLQKERAKPENKTPEQQKKLNEALSKLLKAMSAASRK